MVDQDFPPRFAERVLEIFGESVGADVLATLVPRPITFRINPLRGDASQALEEFARQGLALREIPWLSGVYLLESGTKRELTETMLWRSGVIYLQSLASMVPPLVLDPLPGEEVLDLTAAPGSKTSQIAAMMERRGYLVANDSSRSRFFKMLANLTTLGVYVKGDPFCALEMQDGVRLCRRFKGRFSKILLDAPCSGESRFVKGEPASFGYWSERKVKLLAQTQFRLLRAAWEALAPGGRLVYSTCTMAPEENELVIERFVERQGEEVEILAANVPCERLPPLTEWRGKRFSQAIARTARLAPSLEVESFFVAHLGKRG